MVPKNEREDKREDGGGTVSRNINKKLRGDTKIETKGKKSTHHIIKKINDLQIV